MSETVKLIIEIPEESYKEIKEGIILRNFCIMATAIQNGIPLEEVRIEINSLPRRLFEGYFFFKDDDVLKIIDNIGKGDKEKC